MRKRIPIKNHHHEIQLIAQRSMIGLGFCVMLILLLALRLAYLQLYKHDMYVTMSTKNWLDLIPVEPTRGLIYDRNGKLLAENIPIFSLEITPLQVKNLKNTLSELKKIVTLNDNDISQVYKQLKQLRRFDQIPLKLRLSEGEVARFTENQHRFPGVAIKARLMRRYPQGAVFAHVLGYVGRINPQELADIDQINYSASHYIGKLGIEKFYESELHGKVGYEEVENDASGKPLRVLNEIKSSPGKNIYLSIDSRLQLAVDHALGSARGAVVAIQPATGQVLAMVSKPSYDPNQFVVGMNQKDFQALQQSEDRPLYNRAVRGLYSPASTIKPILAIKGLDTGFITPDYTMVDQAKFQLRNNSHPFHDWARQGHGVVDVSKAITSSCDIFFYDLANRMGIDHMTDILNQFGFGAATGIDLDDELVGVVPTPAWKQKTKGMSWYEADTILAGIGHGYLQVTPLQLAIATATIANHGQPFMPYLLLAEQAPGEAYSPVAPIPLNNIELQNKAYWDIIIKAMQDVVAAKDGTAHRAFGRNYTYSIAAKTGTGQISKRRNPDEEDNQDYLPERLRDHHLFIAFAPVEKPQIALAVVTENSNAAAKTARQIFDFYFNSMASNATSPSRDNATVYASHDHP